jgi:flagellar hook-length control protein FliK
MPAMGETNMAITTGAADAGVLNLNVGSRPRAGTAGDGDEFASALDTQMQNPRTESRRTDPRPKPESRSQAPAAKDKNDDQPKAREGRVADGKGAESKEGSGKGAKKETAEPDQNLVAMLLQTRLPEAETKPEARTVAETATAEGGKELPQAATESAAALLAAATTGDTAKGSATTPVGRTIDPRLAAATPVTDMAALEAPDAAEGEATDALLTSRAGDGAKAETPASPLQPARADLATQSAASKGEKADAFAATLAALRDAAPRSSNDGTAPVVTSPAVAIANGPQGASNTAAAPNLPAVNVPVGQQGWDQAVGERVLWMTRHGLQEAKIELHPRELGPVEIRVSVQDDQASVAFTTHSPAARDALEAAMPRLRDMLADSGLNLAQSDVSHRSPQQQAESGWGNGGQQGSGNLLGGGAEEQPTAAVETPLPSLGAVDYYA